MGAGETWRGALDPKLVTTFPDGLLVNGQVKARERGAGGPTSFPADVWMADTPETPPLLTAAAKVNPNNELVNTITWGTRTSQRPLLLRNDYPTPLTLWQRVQCAASWHMANRHHGRCLASIIRRTLHSNMHHAITSDDGPCSSIIYCYLCKGSNADHPRVSPRIVEGQEYVLRLLRISRVPGRAYVEIWTNGTRFGNVYFYYPPCGLGTWQETLFFYD